MISQNLSSRIPGLVSLWRGGQGKGSLSRAEIKTAGEALLSLQRGLTGDRRLAGADYMDTDSLLGAYLLYYWPVSYLQVSYALQCGSHVFSSYASKKTVRILDLGSGPGPASAAVADYMCGGPGPVPGLEFVFADSGRKALTLAEKILKSGKSAAHVVKTLSCSADLEKNTDAVPAGPYDVIVMSHSLNELWRTDKDCIGKRASFLGKLGGMLSPDGIIFIVEPALLETSRALLEVRDVLAGRGFTVCAPCMSDSACPALAAGPNHTCHAEIPWSPVEPVSSLAAAAGLDRESVKMSFMILKRASAAPAAAETGRPLTARVVSDGMMNKAGRIRFLLCDGKSRFAFSAKKDDAGAAAAGFFALRRYDLVEISNPELRGDRDNPAYGFGKDTLLKVCERLGD